MNKCCICNQPFEGMGNNPWPVVDAPGKRCCDECDNNIVLLARIKAAIG